MGIILISSGNVFAVENNSLPTNHQLTSNLSKVSTSTNLTDDNLNQTTNSTTDKRTETKAIQSELAAGSPSYNKAKGIWLLPQDVASLKIQSLKNAGITDIFILCNSGGKVSYSTLKKLLSKTKGSGIRVHAWLSCFHINGKWVDPKSSQGAKLSASLLKTISTITRNYAVAGIHLDYVRYPGDAYKHPGGSEAIILFVKKVKITVKSIKPKVAVSAALMPECSKNNRYYGQDYQKLSQHLDFLVPMIFQGNYGEDSKWIQKTTSYISQHSGNKPLLVGIQTYQIKSGKVQKFSVQSLKNQINAAKKGGADGYVLFRWGLIDSRFFK
jgi:uncharacterized lipoprotein YddW (UPF0748 family)